ncbi:MAG: dual OB domain-containing protein [Candidatus Caccovivens sp.]
MKKQICILTKSLKDNDYCVAGIDISTGKWIRLVTSKDGGAFPKEMLDEKHIKELCVLDIEVKAHVPYHVQTENWLIDENVEVKRIGNLSKQQVFNLHPIEKHDMIFNTQKNELERSDIKTLNHSLEMINVKELQLDTSMKGDGRHHYKVKFQYNGHEYNLALTDPKYRNEDFDQISIPNATIIVSIPAVPYGENDLY